MLSEAGGEAEGVVETSLGLRGEVERRFLFSAAFCRFHSWKHCLDAADGLRSAAERRAECDCGAAECDNLRQAAAAPEDCVPAVAPRAVRKQGTRGGRDHERGGCHESAGRCRTRAVDSVGDDTIAKQP